MTQTLVSTTALYATPTDLVTWHDKRKVMQLASDTGVPLADSQLAMAGHVPVNGVLAAMLYRASGEVEQSCFKGGRYSAADLDLIADLDDTGVAGVQYRSAKHALRGLVSDLAFWHLTKRRFPETDLEDIPGATKAYAMLEELEAGTAIFPFQQSEDAGNMNTHRMTDADYNHLGLASTQAARLFGRRAGRNRDRL